jgi:hypothetical protein
LYATLPEQLREIATRASGRLLVNDDSVFNHDASVAES